MAQTRFIKSDDVYKEAYFETVGCQIEHKRRSVLQIVIEGTLEEARGIFDNIGRWYMVTEIDGEQIETVDYSVYSIPYYYSDLCNGKVAVGMAKLTELESLIDKMYGVINNE